MYKIQKSLIPTLCAILIATHCAASDTLEDVQKSYRRSISTSTTEEDQKDNLVSTVPSELEDGEEEKMNIRPLFASLDDIPTLERNEIDTKNAPTVEKSGDILSNVWFYTWNVLTLPYTLISTPFTLIATLAYGESVEIKKEELENERDSNGENLLSSIHKIPGHIVEDLGDSVRITNMSQSLPLPKKPQYNN